MKSYSLALTYALFVFFDVKQGNAASEIESIVVNKRLVHFMNIKWGIDDDELEWYKRFSESNKILESTYEDVFNEVKSKEILEIDKNREKIDTRISELTKFAQDKESKLERLIKLMVHAMPEVDFFKILSSLRTEIMIITYQGMGDKTESSGTGSKYIREILINQEIKFGKLNQAVYFCFINEIRKNESAKFFDLEKWGKQLEEKANERRKLDHSHKKFNFIIMKSSLHDFKFFGDVINKGRIDIPPELLEGIKPEESTFSTLRILAKALQQKDVSLAVFINKHLQYLDGIPDDHIEKRISAHLVNIHKKTEWLISDFVNYGITVKDLMDIDLPESTANLILNEAKTVKSLLHL